MNVIESWEIEGSFWDINPQMKLPTPFKTLYDVDKSKNKAHSSKLMWAIALFADFDSKFRPLSEAERKGLIASDYLNNKDFDWASVEEQIKFWRTFHSPAQKQMVEWERLMNEKNDYMRTLKYDGSTADEIEKRLLSNTKLYDEYEKIKARLNEGGEDGVMFGGGKESLTESGQI